MIKEQVSKKGCTVGSHRNADCLLKTKSSKFSVTYMLSINLLSWIGAICRKG